MQTTGQTGKLHTKTGRENQTNRKHAHMANQQKFTSKAELSSLALPFERRTSTGSEAFSLFICLEATKFVLLSFFSLIKTIYLRVWTKPLPNDAKSPLPVDILRNLVPRAVFPGFGGGAPHLQGKAPWGPGCVFRSITSISSPFTGTRLCSRSPSKGNNFEVQ